MYKWTRALIKELLIEYKSQSVLYDLSHPDYNNRVKRIYAFQKIVNALRCHGFQGTEEVVKRKLHTLRNQYIKEYRDLQKSQENGNEINTKLWCFEYLDFLRPHCKRKTSINPLNISNENTTNDVDSDISSNCDDSKFSADGMDMYPAKRKRESMEVIPQTIHRHSTESRNTHVQRSSKSSSYTWLGRQVIFEMGNIQNETIRQDTSWAIQSILREGIKKDRESRQNYKSRLNASSLISADYVECKKRQKRSYSPISDMSEVPMDDVFEDDRSYDALEP